MEVENLRGECVMNHAQIKWVTEEPKAEEPKAAEPKKRIIRRVVKNGDS